MPDIRKSYVGFAAGAFSENLPGQSTGVHFLPMATENLGGGETIEHVRDEFNFGAATPRNSYVAARGYGGPITVPNARIVDFGKIGKFAFGRYTITNDTPAVGVNKHDFDILETSVGSSTVLPSATALLGVGGIKHVEYVGGQCNEFAVSSSAESHSISMSTTWIFRDRLDASAAIPTYSSTARSLLWRNLAVEIDGAPWPDIDSFEIRLRQGVAGFRGANQSPTIAYYDRSGNVEVTLSLGLRYTGNYHASVRDGLYHNMKFSILDGPDIIEFSLPRIQFESTEASIAGNIPQSLSASAYRDEVTGTTMRMTIYRPDPSY